MNNNHVLVELSPVNDVKLKPFGVYELRYGPAWGIFNPKRGELKWTSCPIATFDCLNDAKLFKRTKKEIYKKNNLVDFRLCQVDPFGDSSLPPEYIDANHL